MGLAAKAEAFRAAAAGPDFHAIGDYGFLSDCHTGALVAPDGTVEWMCLRRFDSPSIFAAILDRDAGAFRLGPNGPTGAGPPARPPGHQRARTSWMSARGGACPGRPDARASERENHKRARSRLGPHDAEHLSSGRSTVSTARPRWRSLRAGLRLRQEPPSWRLVDRAARARASGAGSPSASTATSRWRARPACRADSPLPAGEPCFSCLAWRRSSPAGADAADAVS